MRKIANCIIAVLLIANLSIPGFVWANDTRGPQGSTGPQAQVGTNGNTGPQQPTGPQTETGNIDPEEYSNLVSQESNTLDEIDNSASDPSSEINTENVSNINNDADISIDTGNNSIGSSSSVGNLNTGNIDGSLTIVNVSNTQLAEGSSIGAQNLSNSDGDLFLSNISDNRIDFINNTTGANSINSNEYNGENVITVFDLNDSEILNAIDVLLNTGFNDIGANTSVGNIITGDISFSLTLVNLLNLIMPNVLLTLDIWNLADGYDGDIILDNQNTGESSGNSNSLAMNGNMDIEVENDADISNDISIEAETGNNLFNNNTIVGDIGTGEVNVDSDIYNIANLTDPLGCFYLFNIFGEFNGVIDSELADNMYINMLNNSSGPNSYNTNSIQQQNELNESVENTANLENIVNLSANTGNNSVSNNTVVQDISSGSIDISASLINFVNSISDGAGKIAFKIINIFGNLNGDITDNADDDGDNNPPPPNEPSQDNEKEQKPIADNGKGRGDSNSTDIDSETSIDISQDNDSIDLSYSSSTKYSSSIKYAQASNKPDIDKALASSNSSNWQDVEAGNRLPLYMYIAMGILLTGVAGLILTKYTLSS